MKVNIRREHIKDLRAARGWTQEQLAEVAGLHTRTIQRMENNGSTSAGSLDGIANALGVPAQTLELKTSEIDFTPVLTELRILRSAIFRKIAPTTNQGLPRLFSA